MVPNCVLGTWVTLFDINKNCITYKKNKNKKAFLQGLNLFFPLTLFFFFFLRKKLTYFINLKQLHPNLKSKQYAMGHLPSILENLVCIMHFSPDYE